MTDRGELCSCGFVALGVESMNHGGVAGRFVPGRFVSGTRDKKDSWFGDCQYHDDDDDDVFDVVYLYRYGIWSNIFR